MRIAGLNVLAIIGAAISVYAVGFVIYGLVLDPANWMAMAGITKEQMEAVGMSRMPYSPLIPLVIAIGMAILFKWADVTVVANGVKWAALVACLSAIPALWYGWVYGVGPASGTLLDSVHLLAGHSVAGAILARWR